MLGSRVRAPEGVRKRKMKLFRFFRSLSGSGAGHGRTSAAESLPFTSSGLHGPAPQKEKQIRFRTCFEGFRTGAVHPRLSILSTDGFVARTSCSICCCVGEPSRCAGAIRTSLFGMFCVTTGTRMARPGRVSAGVGTGSRSRSFTASEVQSSCLIVSFFPDTLQRPYRNRATTASKNRPASRFRARSRARSRREPPGMPAGSFRTKRPARQSLRSGQREIATQKSRIVIFLSYFWAEIRLRATAPASGAAAA